MGDIKGFLKYSKKDFTKQPPEIRKKHWKEFIDLLPDEELKWQAARCMNCGIPFCHWGCPLGNIIPDWNDLVHSGRWKEAYYRLAETNNFPEFTGRVCPAPCEHSCVLGINKDPVTIRNVELAIVEKAFEQGWVIAKPPVRRSGKTVAVIGSGPAGLSCADQLNHLGHTVTVFEKNEDLGGILVLGIPNFKLEKHIVLRRIDVMRQEGVVFKTRCHVGVDVSFNYLRKEFDAIVLASGAEEPRDLNIPGRELAGVYQAMDFLRQQNRLNRGETILPSERITAKDKNVIILGGGDTGSDCVGTANRQGAKTVKQFEILPCPPKQRMKENPWPLWALVHRQSSSQEEGVDQDFCILTKHLSGEQGKLKKLHGVKLVYGPRDPVTGRLTFKEEVNSDFSVDCDLLILAMGFVGPSKKEVEKDLKINLDQRGNITTDENNMTHVGGIFSAGDAHRGQSLIVWAIHEGRKTAKGVHQWLSDNASMNKVTRKKKMC